MKARIFIILALFLFAIQSAHSDDTVKRISKLESQLIKTMDKNYFKVLRKKKGLNHIKNTFKQVKSLVSKNQKKKYLNFQKKLKRVKKNKIKKKKKKKIKRKPGTIIATGDDVLKVYVNGKNVQIPNSKTWYESGKVTVKMTSGDEIKFVCTNIGAYHEGNPAGILGVIHYVDKRGKKRTIVTDKKWKCNGKHAKEIGNNGGDNRWARNLGGKPVSGIPTSAKWIWYVSPIQTTTCKIRLP